MNYEQQVRSVKISKLTKFRDDIISIGFMASQIMRYDIKIWRRHFSVENTSSALKFCKHLTLL